VHRDAIAFTLAGTLFGLLVGWMIGSQAARSTPQGAATAPAAAPSRETSSAAPPRLDEARVASLRAAAVERPQDPQPRIELGNLYFDAEQYQEAIKWYEEALKLDPRNVNVSTDLGVSYYYTDQPDRALAQFEQSLRIDPKHTKTILNLGIVRAFGKQDLAGAMEAWQRVIELAPDSPEGRAAKQALDSLRAAHPQVGTR
jgi:tetratricopeptide (TPR) repeat protein